MADLFVYQNGSREEQLFFRPIYRTLIQDRSHRVVLGCCRDDEDLLGDLCPAGVAELRVSTMRNTPRGAALDLGHLRRPGEIAIDMSVRPYRDVWSYRWQELCITLDLRLAEQDLPAPQLDETEVPMLDLPPDTLGIPEVPPGSIYLDNHSLPNRWSYSRFDLERLLRCFPEQQIFCCAGTQGLAASTLHDISDLSLRQQVAVSIRCGVLVGGSRYPFAATLHEANRHKPKAVCGYDARKAPIFWDYPENPLELLPGMDELVDFLLAWQQMEVPCPS